jgi:CubicO group peptidase (beta-lactamase class C family)
MNELQVIFDEAAADHTFPGGSVYLAKDGKVLAHAAFGTTAYDAPISRLVTLDTLYDVASVTKLWTSTAFLIAARENNIPIETPVAHFIPQFAVPELAQITLRHLLNHSHGLALALQDLTHVPLDEWITRITGAGLQSETGAQTRYMCTPYFLLGKLIEEWSGLSLDRFEEERLTIPLGQERTLYNPLRRFAAEEIAPTEIDAQSGEPWRGVVHDEAARALGGVSGNSGIFSTAGELSRFAQMWLDEGAYAGQQLIHPEDVRRALTDVIVGEKYSQGLGWHLDVSSWMSPQAPRGTAGHLGFTGPSLFITPQRHICIVLDNRVFPTREGPLRLRYHRRIAEWLFANS